MNQKDIDRLLTCRKAMDDHRDRKGTARGTAKSAGNLSTAYVAMQDAFTVSINTYLAVLAENGFETYDDFVQFNRTMCIESIRENVTFTGKCAVKDGCKGCYENGIVPVDFAYSPGQLCFYSADAPSLGKYDWQTMLYDHLIGRGHQFAENKDGTYRIVCPENTGYSITVKEMLFDWWWV